MPRVKINPLGQTRVTVPAGRTWLQKLGSMVAVNVNPKKGGITNRTVEALCKLKCGERFIGVFSADCIPKDLGNWSRFIVIINLGRRGRSVGHFVTIVGRPSSIHYLDSYGLPPFQPDVVRFLESCHRPVHHNREQIQSITSQHCGLYAILFACVADGKEKSSNVTFHTGGNEKAMRKNDFLCRRYLKRIYSIN